MFRLSIQEQIVDVAMWWWCQLYLLLLLLYPSLCWQVMNYLWLIDRFNESMTMRIYVVIHFLNLVFVVVAKTMTRQFDDNHQLITLHHKHWYNLCCWCLVILSRLDCISFVRTGHMFLCWVIVFPIEILFISCVIRLVHPIPFDTMISFNS
jgi:hypothetical protein